MRLQVVGCFLLFAALASAPCAKAEDWPQWRGPTGDNHAASGATAPTTWSDDTKFAWRTAVPGRGHSSPVLVGDKLYLTTCDEQTEAQMLLVFDRGSGQLLKQTAAHQGKLPARIHGNNTHASPTVACDGKQIYAAFCNDDAVWVTAFDLEGEKLWQQRVAGFDPQRYKFGFGTSPICVGDLIVIASEYDGPDSGIHAIRASDGKPAWRAPRPNLLSNSSPILVNLAGKSQLLISGNHQVAAYDPDSGEQMWTVKAPWQATCGTMVWDPQHNIAFASGGYPANHTVAVRADGSEQAVWQNDTKCYEQSMLVKDGYLYAVADNGIAHCYRTVDGEEMWKQRLAGPVSSSPVLVGDTIYVTNERGVTFVFGASPQAFELVAKNQLGDDCFATPTPADGRLYHRYAVGSGSARQEYLVAIGE